MQPVIRAEHLHVIAAGDLETTIEVAEQTKVARVALETQTRVAEKPLDYSRCGIG